MKHNHEVIESAANEYVEEQAPLIFKNLNKAGIKYSDELLCNLMHDAFVAGVLHVEELLRSGDDA